MRARQPGMITNTKPSVIVVQKGGGGPSMGCLRTTRPATVSLYRPRPLAPGVHPPRLAGGQNDSGNLILVDLAQAQDSTALSSLFSASGVLPDPGEGGGGQRKIFLQRPGNPPTTSMWGETSTASSSDPPISMEVAQHPPGRLVTLPPRSISTPQESPAPSPPSLEVVPGRQQQQANGEA